METKAVPFLSGLSEAQKDQMKASVIDEFTHGFSEIVNQIKQYNKRSI